jgi:hypothetical protein
MAAKDRLDRPAFLAIRIERFVDSEACGAFDTNAASARPKHSAATRQQLMYLCCLLTRSRARTKRRAWRRVFFATPARSGRSILIWLAGMNESEPTRVLPVHSVAASHSSDAALPPLSDEAFI